MPGCSGKCCSVFNYSRSLDDLKASNDDHSKFLVDMLIELTPEEAEARAERFEVTPPEGYTVTSWAHADPTYTCRHWDEETKLCGVYEDRPQMCADYPYGRACQHDCECVETGFSAERRAENSNPSAVNADAVSSRS